MKKDEDYGNTAKELIVTKKIKGKKWVEKALPVMVGISREVKMLEEEKAKESEAAKAILKSIVDEYAPGLKALAILDEGLRERVMVEHEGSESVIQENIGELVFPMLWGFEVIDINKVDRKYLTVNSTAVREDIKKGVRKISGITVKQKRSLQIRTNIDSNQPV